MPKRKKILTKNNIGYQLKCSECEITYRCCPTKREFTKKLMDKHMLMTHNIVNRPIINESQMCEVNGSLTVKRIT
jgi:hypothetical protein